MDILHFLFETPMGWGVMAVLIVPGAIFFMIAAKKNVQKDASLERLGERDLVARSIERGDYLGMPEADFRRFLSDNAQTIFQNEREAMERARRAKFEPKPEPRREKQPQKPDRLHPYQN